MSSTEKSCVARRVAYLLVVVGLALASSVEMAAQRDALAGTWKLNPAKSTYSPGPAPRSETVTYEAAGAGVKYSVTQIDDAGTTTRLEGSLMYDGKEYPATGTADYDTVATRRINANTGETVRTKSGKIVQTVTRVLSADGKTLTLTTKGVNAKGESISSVAVYERQ